MLVTYLLSRIILFLIQAAVGETTSWKTMISEQKVPTEEWSRFGHGGRHGSHAKRKRNHCLDEKAHFILRIGLLEFFSYVSRFVQPFLFVINCLFHMSRFVQHIFISIFIFLTFLFSFFSEPSRPPYTRL